MKDHAQIFKWQLYGIHILDEGAFSGNMIILDSARQSWLE